MNSNQDSSRDPDLVTALIGHSHYVRNANTLNRLYCVYEHGQKKAIICATRFTSFD
jgi:hypothetical protein